MYRPQCQEGFNLGVGDAICVALSPEGPFPHKQSAHRKVEIKRQLSAKGWPQNIQEIRLEYEACLTKLKADSTSKDSAIKSLQDNISEETSQNKASLKKEHDATRDLKMKQKKEIETNNEAIRVMQHKIAEEKTKG